MSIHPGSERRKSERRPSPRIFFGKFAVQRESKKLRLNFLLVLLPQLPDLLRQALRKKKKNRGIDAGGLREMMSFLSSRKTQPTRKMKKQKSRKVSMLTTGFPTSRRFHRLLSLSLSLCLPRQESSFSCLQSLCLLDDICLSRWLQTSLRAHSAVLVFGPSISLHFHTSIHGDACGYIYVYVPEKRYVQSEREMLKRAFFLRFFSIRRFELKPGFLYGKRTALLSIQRKGRTTEEKRTEHLKNLLFY